MTRDEYLKAFEATTTKMLAITKAKNSDYCGPQADADPFHNFRLVETLGITTMQKGLLVRMADKIARITSLIDAQAQVKDEAIEDTLLDLANYAIILACVRKGGGGEVSQLELPIEKPKQRYRMRHNRKGFLAFTVGKTYEVTSRGALLDDAGGIRYEPGFYDDCFEAIE